VGSNCNSSNAKSWEISHYANQTFLTASVIRELIVRETYGLSMRNSTRSLSNRNMSTRYHTTDTNTPNSDNDSFTHQTAEVNISPRTVPRTAPDNTIRACSYAIQGRCISCTSYSQPSKYPVCPNMTKQMKRSFSWKGLGKWSLTHARTHTNELIASECGYSGVRLDIASSLVSSTIFMANT
jgi:hypothetical protein